MPLPMTEGRPARRLCEFCYALSSAESFPPGWGRVVRVVGFDVETLDACQSCVGRMEAAAGYLTPRGAYATGPDPRGTDD
jgi:hypothetical protein